MPRSDTAVRLSSDWEHAGKCQCIVRAVDEFPANSERLQSRESRSLCSAVSVFGLVIKLSSDPSWEGFFCVLVMSEGYKAWINEKAASLWFSFCKASCLEHKWSTWQEE